MSFDTASALFNLGKTAIEKIWPDPTRRAQELRLLEELKQTGNMALLDAHVKLMIGQMEVNKVEAASDNIFKSGWRPFVGWVCGSALIYTAILEPVARFVASMYGYSGEFPIIDTQVTLQVLMGMLGLGAMRSFDKKEVLKK